MSDPMSDPEASLFTVRRLVGELFAALRGRMVLALVLMVAIMLTEGVGLILLIPLLDVAGFESGEAGGLGEWVESALAVVGLEPRLGLLLGLFVVVTAGRAGVERWQTVNQAAVTETFLHHLRTRLYRAYVRARYEYITRTRSPDFIHALTEETSRVGQAVQQVIQLTGQAVVALVFIAIALRISWEATLVATASAAVLFLVLWGRARRSEGVGRTLTAKGAGMVSTATEHLAGLKTAKSYGVEASHERAFSSFSERVAHAGVDAYRTYADVTARFQIAATALAALVIYASLEWLAVPSGELLVLVFILARLVPKFSKFQNGLQRLLHALPAYARVSGLLEDAEAHADPVAPEDAGAPAYTRAHGEDGIAANQDDIPAGDIVFDSVSFAYPFRTDGGRLEDLDLVIVAGGITGIVGPSGAGKSTVADLLTGLLTPDSGQIQLGGRALGPANREAWRARIGYVPQETFLFHDTIRANLRWARPGASEDQLWTALGQARATEFVRRLPDGLDTVVGDRGVQLSGGERQRLSLARALLREPDMLILDEATSALDRENEMAILKALEALHGRLTVVLITHRLASVRDADRVYVMESGRIVDSGPPSDVLGSEARIHAPESQTGTGAVE